MPGVFIGNCLEEPEEGTFAISVINTTENQVAIPTMVNIEEIPDTVSDSAEKPVLYMTQRESKKSPLKRMEQLKELIRTEHLNKEEKNALERICEEFCDIFYLEDDALSCTTTVSHEINTRTDSAPVNVRPYRLPEKHKKEVNRQIEKMLSEGIIRPSTSQWNAPILVVLKKGDASGKQKLSSRLSKAKRFDDRRFIPATKHYRYSRSTRKCEIFFDLRPRIRLPSNRDERERQK